MLPSCCCCSETVQQRVIQSAQAIAHSMDTSLPECDGLKKRYDDCYTAWRYQKSDENGHVMKSLYECNDVFEVMTSAYTAVDIDLIPYTFCRIIKLAMWYKQFLLCLISVSNLNSYFSFRK